MKEKINQAIRGYRLENPGATKGLTDMQVLEQMFLVLSRLYPSLLRVVDLRDGELKFSIR
jgi:hypothetical protein